MCVWKCTCYPKLQSVFFDYDYASMCLCLFFKEYHFFTCLVSFGLTYNTSVWLLDIRVIWEHTAYCTLVCLRQEEQKSIEKTRSSPFPWAAKVWLIEKSYLQNTQKTSLHHICTDSVEVMVAWGIHWEQTISTCHYFSVKFVQWDSAMRCVCIAKMGLGTCQIACVTV